MGTVKEFKCPTCYGTWRLRVGHGMMHGSLKHVLETFPADIQQKILADIKGEQAPFFNFNYRAAECPQCQAIVAVPVIYLHETKQTYSSGCPECGNMPSMLPEDSAVICPHCKKGQLFIQNIGDWD